MLLPFWDISQNFSSTLVCLKNEMLPKLKFELETWIYFQIGTSTEDAASPRFACLRRSGAHKTGSHLPMDVSAAVRVGPWSNNIPWGSRTARHQHQE